MKVIQLLKEWYSIPEKKIKQIEQQIKECNKCDGKGNLKTNDSNSFGGFSFPKHCDCLELNGKIASMYELDLLRVKKGMAFIDNQVPNEFKENMIITQDEIDFIKSNKKILWLYNRNKGAGKTTRSFSIAAISRVILGFNVRFINESRIPFNQYSQEYNLDFEHQELIVVDDAGTETDRKGLLSDFYYKFFNDIRFTNCKIIFTSQFSISEWIARIKDIEQRERIGDRFKGITIEKQIGIKDT